MHDYTQSCINLCNASFVHRDGGGRVRDLGGDEVIRVTGDLATYDHVRAVLKQPIN